jgi:hypothetical protein
MMKPSMPNGRNLRRFCKATVHDPAARTKAPSSIFKIFIAEAILPYQFSSPPGEKENLNTHHVFILFLTFIVIIAQYLFYTK